MNVQALKCLICDSIIYSRSQHDFRKCECGQAFVDGGFDYLRSGAECPEKIAYMSIDVDATHKELYDDWNGGNDKFGLIRSKENNDG